LGNFEIGKLGNRVRSVRAMQNHSDEPKEIPNFAIPKFQNNNMPELPDLEVFSHNLHKKLAGKKIKKVTVLQTKKLNVTAATLRKQLQKKTVQTIYRSGKELFIECEDGTVLGLHLMLRGKLEWFTKKNHHKYTIMELLFDDDTGLAITDPQRQAAPTLNPEEDDVPDALSKKVNVAYLKELLQQSSKPVKTVLTDQSLIRGLGNAYADEILYHARIDPFSISKKIPASSIKVLARSIKTVLKKAEKQIRKIDPDIIGGELRDFLAVHHNRKTHSPGGVLIKHKTLNSRKTYYTSEQKLYR
jgi:formamidopyrimidine-DNA glycosylase